MLVLTRKLHEVIHIGDGVTVTVVKLAGSNVRLGIEAPRGVPIVRGELTPEQLAERLDEPPAAADAALQLTTDD